jgi:hypothetical protein
MTFPLEWHTLGREAELAAEQLAIGVTALGRANHTQMGLYHQAFFAGDVPVIVEIDGAALLASSL